MSQSISKVYLHIVFSTKDRTPWISYDIENRLYAYLASICEKIKCPAISIGGMEDHVHCLLLYTRTISISELLEKMKSNSSRWIKSLGDNYQDFAWQRGYGAFSVDQISLDPVKKYIANQKDHHKKRDFKEEYLLILKRYAADYNEQYLWD